MAGLRIMGIATPRSRIPQTYKFAQRRISSKKLSFLTEVLDRYDHSGHYQSGQSTVQLSSKCIEEKTYIDAYNCSYSKNNASIQHSNMFNTFHQAITLQEIQLHRLTQTITLILRRICLATSYVAATFHPTIVYCTHQSLSNTTTPMLGMISSRNKGTPADSYIAKGATKLSQANIVGFIKLEGETTNRWVSQAT